MAEEENRSIYRKKSLEWLSAPKDLNKYVRVCKPGTVVILIAILLFVVGLLIWAALTDSGDGSFLRFLLG